MLTVWLRTNEASTEEVSDAGFYQQKLSQHEVDAWDQFSEFYNEPISLRPYGPQNKEYKAYRELKFSNFTLRADRINDPQVYVISKKKNRVVHVERIIRVKITQKVFIEGRYYKRQ